MSKIPPKPFLLSSIKYGDRLSYELDEQTHVSFDVTATDAERQLPVVDVTVDGLGASPLLGGQASHTLRGILLGSSELASKEPRRLGQIMLSAPRMGLLVEMVVDGQLDYGCFPAPALSSQHFESSTDY